jgi:hypothetical protein
MLRNLINCGIRDLQALGRRADTHNPLDLVGIVWRCRDDEKAGQEIWRNAVRSY